MSLGANKQALMGAAGSGGAADDFYDHQIAKSVRVPATSSTSSNNGRLTRTFGTVDSSGTSGTITTSGAVSGGVTDFDATGRAAASFSVTGEANSSYTFNLPATATLDDGGAGDTMTVPLSFASGSSSRTLSSGAETVAVNGSLAVAANQLAATYTGTYTVNVEY